MDKCGACYARLFAFLPPMQNLKISPLAAGKLLASLSSPESLPAEDLVGASLEP